MPVLVPVMIRLFEPVYNKPLVMVTLLAVTLLLSVIEVPALTFTVRLLNVVAPVMVELEVAANTTVPVDGVNVPWFTKLPFKVCVNVLAANVTPVLIVNTLFTVTPAEAVLVPPPANTKLSYVIPFTLCADALLNVTVFGFDEVTLNVPAVKVSVPAIPKLD